MEETIHKIGRRKTAVARVYLKKGKGKITVEKNASIAFSSIKEAKVKITY